MKNIKLLVFICFTNIVFSQTLTADIELGVNMPSDDFATSYETKDINGLTANFGIRYMFWRKLGAKVDYGFNRYANLDDTPEFKANYNRVDLQLYYNIWDQLYNFQIRLPERVGVFLHAGGGMSFIKPLKYEFRDNKTSNFNWMAGVSAHYAISEKTTIYVDASKIFNLNQEISYEGTQLVDPINTDMFTITLGVSFSLNSKCYYCDKPEPLK